MALNFIPRGPKRKLAILIIGLGVLLALPPFVNIFIIDDVLNIFIAKSISERFGISMLNGLILSYTLVAWSIIFIGFYIFPYNTERLMNGMLNRTKNGIRIYINKVKKHPLNLIWAGAILFIFYRIYLFFANSAILSFM